MCLSSLKTQGERFLSLSIRKNSAHFLLVLGKTGLISLWQRDEALRHLIVSHTPSWQEGFLGQEAAWNYPLCHMSSASPFNESYCFSMSFLLAYTVESLHNAVLP